MGSRYPRSGVVSCPSAKLLSCSRFIASPLTFTTRDIDTMATPTASQFRSLYRDLLRTGSKFASYNFREYALRRTKDAFRQNATNNDPEIRARLYAQGKKELAVATRQAAINSMYGGQKLVIETRTQGKRKRHETVGNVDEGMVRGDT